MKKIANPEFEAFTKTMKHLLSIPHKEIMKRMEKYKQEGPHKRGPKPKSTSASRATGAKI